MKYESVAAPGARDGTEVDYDDEHRCAEHEHEHEHEHAKNEQPLEWIQSPYWHVINNGPLEFLSQMDINNYFHGLATT